MHEQVINIFNKKIIIFKEAKHGEINPNRTDQSYSGVSIILGDAYPG
jgi:hypothetical protein